MPTGRAFTRAMQRPRAANMQGSGGGWGREPGVVAMGCNYAGAIAVAGGCKYAGGMAAGGCERQEK
ncbi:hypothetical protein SAMN05421878_102223 [Actinobaculum suis]|uniref:Uncharacterized protein n=1 Tax=Actinobaculum suis TaxID=1657 RepID=A0A1G7AH90_9ACTO|nr:hypothetical protein SAMN05421878_102223 [Actinobaculum suis]